MTNALQAINDMTTHIATAATEQSSVTEEINRNMVAIKGIVAELLESNHESASISQEISGVGNKLKSLVVQFKL